MQKDFTCSLSGSQKEKKECDESLSEKLFDLLVSDAAGAHSTKRSSFGAQARMEDTQLLLANGHFSKVSIKLADDIFYKVQNVGHVKKVQSELFPAAKKQLLLQIQNLPISEKKKQEWTEKIKSIEFGGTDCSAIRDPKQSRLAQAFTANAYYMTGENNFYICPGISAQKPNDALTTLIIAHELSHSIGPCSEFYSKAGGKESQKTQYPLKNLVACLRNEKSIQAKYDFGKDNFAVEAIKRPFLKAGFLDRDKCNQDQTNEVVPDWLAVETVASLLVEKYKNTDRITAIKEITSGWGYICPTGAESDVVSSTGRFRSHPDMRSRVNKIFLQNPKIRFLLGCPQSKTSGYCDAIVDRPVKSVFGIVKVSPDNVEPAVNKEAAK
tara:strand:- start:459 stop:1604 length:1146 start_codon:yes stop_codon:yes gene_type:complete